MAHVEFSWVAKKPFDAEHPPGSGEVVHYEPGDVVPANDWGQAAHHMEANDKIAQLAVNVLDPGDTEGAAVPLGEGAVVRTGKGLSDPDREYLAYEGQGKKKRGAAAAVLEEPVLEPESMPSAEEIVNGPVDEGDVEFPRHLGGGVYELSDGSQVKGRRMAVAAESALTEG